MERRSNNILWGVFFILIGICYGGNAFGLWHFNLFFKGWWTLIIIVPCLFGILSNGLALGKIIGIILGVIFLLNEQNIIISKSISKLIFPAILIWIGISVIRNGVYIHKNKDEEIKRIDGNIYENTNMKKLEFTSIFSGVERKITNEIFRDISMFSLFGGIDLDLRDAKIDRDIKIDAICMFGGIDLLIPNNVKVKTSGIPIFGGTSNLTKTPIEENVPTIYIDYVCIFGGIDIK